MSLSDSGLKALVPRDKKYRVSVSDALFIIVYPNGGKYFVWRYRFPPDRSGQFRDYQIGPYGKGVGKWSLKQARDEKDRLDQLRKAGEDPRLLKSEAKREVLQQALTPSVQKAAEGFLDRSKNKPSTINDYRNMLFNQVLPVLGPDTPVNRFEWSVGGREKILQLKEGIEARGSLYQSDKCFMVMRGMFDYAIDRGWMQPPNPAMGSKQAKSKHKAKSNPSLNWNQLPKFFEDLERNDPGASLVVVLSVKVLALTFSRVGSLVPTKWEEIDLKKDLWTIPGERMKMGKDHSIPLTDPIKEVFDTLRSFNGDKDYVFFSPRGRVKPHISRDSPNHHLASLGYKGMTTAHGFRHLALTAGQEVLKVDHEIIQRQMAHSFGDKIRGHYDKSQMLDERREFMIQWCDALVEQGLIT
mgnify:CR=1 FL=1